MSAVATSRFPLPSRTPEEELRDKIAELERKKILIYQMENDLLKKQRTWKGGIVIFSSSFGCV